MDLRQVHPLEMDFLYVVEITVRVVEALGVASIVLGAIVAAVLVLFQQRQHKDETWYSLYRRNLGQAILLGLEFLVAADIIRTVALQPTLTSVAVLGVIVFIRTFLSFTLELEIDGRWPWQRRPKS